MTGVIDAQYKQNLRNNEVIVNAKCHEINYFLYEISVFFHEPTLLLRAMTQDIRHGSDPAKTNIEKDIKYQEMYE